jgi:hypothetical protein
MLKGCRLTLPRYHPSRCVQVTLEAQQATVRLCAVGDCRQLTLRTAQVYEEGWYEAGVCLVCWLVRVGSPSVEGWHAQYRYACR